MKEFLNCVLFYSFCFIFGIYTRCCLRISRPVLGSTMGVEIKSFTSVVAWTTDWFVSHFGSNTTYSTKILYIWLAFIYCLLQQPIVHLKQQQPEKVATAVATTKATAPRPCMWDFFPVSTLSVLSYWFHSKSNSAIRHQAWFPCLLVLLLYLSFIYIYLADLTVNPLNTSDLLSRCPINDIIVYRRVCLSQGISILFHSVFYDHLKITGRLGVVETERQISGEQEARIRTG